jgi:hypothetical protein
MPATLLARPTRPSNKVHFAASHESGNGTNAKYRNVRIRAAVGVTADVTQTSFEDRCCDHHDAAQPGPTTHDASDDASNPAPVTQDFRYLIYYVWSELSPPEKPADIVLNSLKDIPIGTPVQEIKRASDAFGLDFNFMKEVAKVESGFDPKQRTGSYIGLFQLSKDEFNKCGWIHCRSFLSYPQSVRERGAREAIGIALGLNSKTTSPTFLNSSKSFYIPINTRLHF